MALSSTAFALMESLINFLHDYEMTPGRLLLLLAMLGGSIIMNKGRQRLSRWLELEQWIQLTLKQRDAKVHRVLSLNYNACEGDDDQQPLLTASETRLQIASGQLDTRNNIEQLAKRCRKYGRAIDGINAVTEEYYDEVSYLLTGVPSAIYVYCVELGFLHGIRNRNYDMKTDN